MRWLRPFPLFLLLCFLLLAFFLRVHLLEQFSFWIDEGLTPLRAGYSVTEILSNEIPVQEAVTRDTHPPLYYLLVHALQPGLGPSDFAYRILSAFAGVLLVPVLFQFGRRLFGLTGGLAVALLTAVNPLQVWYGQEARMYTLLTLLGALAVYHLWHALHVTRRGGPRRALLRHSAAFLLWAALAVYTHYTALILFALLALFWLWPLWQAGYRRTIIAVFVGGLLVIGPLLPFTVPRLLSGAEANFFYVSPLIMLQDVVRGFALGVTVTSEPVTLALMGFNALLLVVGFVTLWRRRPSGRLTALLLLTYLLATVAGLALGSLLKPLYQGVRHIMIGSPAYILLAVAGLQGVASWPRPLARAGVLLAAGFLLLGSFRSLDALYNDDRFAKDDMRALVAYVEGQAGPDDVVVYNDAILMLLHQHYQRRADLPVTTEPVYPHAYDARTPVQLAELAANYRRIWFIPTLAAEPPDRDPNAAVHAWLVANAERIIQRNFDARNSALSVETYATGTRLFDALPPDVQPGPTAVDIAGWESDEAQPLLGPALWVDLYWEGGVAPAGRQLRFALTDPDGWSWLEHNQPLNPSGGRWPTDGYRRHSYGLPLPPALPPGTYQLRLQVWSAAGDFVSPWETLGPVTIAARDQWSLAPPLPEPIARFEDDLTLAVPTLDAVRLRPGHTLPIDLIWQAPAKPDGLTFVVEAVAPDGRVVDQWQSPPGPEWLDRWPAASIGDYAAIDIPADAAPGLYTLRGRLLQGETAVPGRVPGRLWPVESVPLGNVTVAPWPLETTLPPVDQTVDAQFGLAPFVRLHGYDLVQADDHLRATLVWQVESPITDNYFTFVHLVDPASGAIAAQVDWVPVEGLRPTGGWRAGEVLVDPYTLPLAAVPPGRYELFVGFFAPDDGRRLSLVTNGDPQPDGRLLLTTIEIIGE